MKPEDRRLMALAFVRFLVLNAILGGVIFGFAGTIAVWQGWFAIAAGLLYMTAMMTIGMRIAPETVRGRAAGLKIEHWWDRVGIFTNLGAMLVAYAVGGLAIRQTGVMPVQWQGLLGAGLIAVEYVLVFFVVTANSWAVGTSRLQPERSQRVVDTGPYGVVRHPMYSASLLYFIGLPLMFGSALVAIPALIAAGALFFRCWHEDRMLSSGLEGYREYSGRVRFRMVPGVF